MPLSQREGRPVWRRQSPLRSLLNALALVGGLLVVAWCWVLVTQNTHWYFLADAFYQGGRLLSRMVPPDWAYWSRLPGPLLDTIHIATLGTIGAILLSVPVALAAARNTTPHPAVRAVALVIIVTSRSVHSLIWALLLVFVFGPGMLAGVLAIALRSIGFIGKLLNEAIEESDPRPVEALAATGASRAQQVAYGIVPQVLPAFLGIVLFRWDINIRESTFLGLVGAGGIGVLLNAGINGLQWSRVSLILLAVLALVLLAEWVSAWARSKAH